MEAGDPPRKNYGLKPRAFERVNTSAGDQQKSTEHDVPAMLRQNRAIAQQAGLNEVKIKTVRSRRKRDYWTALTAGNLLILGLLAIGQINVVSVIFAFSGIILLSVSLTWVIWVVPDDY